MKEPVSERTAGRLAAIVMVSRVDEGLDRAMRYIDHVECERVRAVHVGPEDSTLGAAFWARYGRPLDFVPTQRGLVRTARAIVQSEQAEHPDHLCAVVLPETTEPARKSPVFRPTDASRLTAAFTRERGLVVVNLLARKGDTTLATRTPSRHVALVPVATLHAGTLQTLRVAGVLRPDRVQAVHVAEVSDDAEQLEAEWRARKLPVALDIVAAHQHDLGEPLAQEVAAIKANGADLVTVVLGELVSKWWMRGARNNRALQIKARLGREPDVVVVSVPRER